MHSFETEIDAQACNVSYRRATKVVKSHKSWLDLQVEELKEVEEDKIKEQ